MKKLIALVLLTAALVVAACGGGESTTPGGGGGGDSAATGDTGAIKEGGILRMGTVSNPDSLNPFVGFSALSYIMFTETYPTLVQYDEKYQIIGGETLPFDDVAVAEEALGARRARLGGK